MNVWIKEIKNYDSYGALCTTQYVILFERPRNFLGIKWIGKRYVKEYGYYGYEGNRMTNTKKFGSITQAELFIRNNFNPLKINKTESKIVRSIDIDFL